MRKGSCNYIEDVSFPTPPSLRTEETRDISDEERRSTREKLITSGNFDR